MLAMFSELVKQKYIGLNYKSNKSIISLMKIGTNIRSISVKELSNSAKLYLHITLAQLDDNPLIIV